MNTKQKTRTENEEHVSVYLPSDGTGAYLEGALNGVNFRIPTDQLVSVPRRIARIIAESRRDLLAGSRATDAYSAVGGRKLG
ncbi:MAG: hypothetical protein IJL62_06250 [Clostridia bacterium]|nr:hypothetical protein [Clostridia bacterium]